jgi:hypothetical protein
LTPFFKQLIEALPHLCILDSPFPASTDPSTDSVLGQGFEEVEKIALQYWLSFHEDRETSYTGRLSVEGIGAHDAASYGLENLRSFWSRKPTKLGLMRLHCQLRTK